MGLLFLFFFLSIFFSFLCSVLEAVLLSITPSFINLKEQEGDPIAQDLKVFKDDIDRPLAGILTLNTIAHTVGAIGVGAVAGDIWGDEKMNILGINIAYEGVVAALMTLAILVLSEIIPKTLGANYWKSLTPFTVRVLKMLNVILFPFIFLSQLITKKMKKEKDKAVLTRGDFLAMAKMGQKQGLFREGESKIIQNLLSFNKILVRDVMTPRTVIVSAAEDMTIGDFHAQNTKLRFSRIPIYEKEKDEVTGFVLKDEILLALVNKKGNESLKSIKREIMVTSLTFPIPQLFNLFMEKREHIALVVDEFGGVAGLVTMEDLIETLLGMEIMDEYDNVEDMQAMARKKWESRAKNLGLIPLEFDKDKDEDA